MTFLAACIQTNHSSDMASNMQALTLAIGEAARLGARLVLTPENSDRIMQDKQRQRREAYTEDAHPCIAQFQALAREHTIWLIVGSLAVRADDSETSPLANRSYVFAPDGTQVASYDKIHLFDATVSDKERYCESDTYRAGDTALVVDTELAKLGMTICYDVRFAELFASLAQGGADVITVPAAFTRPTGKAHWQPLLQARAIENSCFILAAAQCGVHDGKRQTWGHSLIIDPWGHILAQANDEPCVIVAPIDITLIHQVRQRLPTHKHHRTFTLKTTSHS